MTIITPKEFENRMKEVLDENKEWIEGGHEDMDALLCEVLKSLGYEDGIDLYLNADKWYM